MSPGQHTAGGGGDQPFGPGFTLRPGKESTKSRRPQYRGGRGGRSGRRGWLLALLALLAAAVVAALVLLVVGRTPGKSTAPTTVPTTEPSTTTVPPALPVQTKLAAWKLPTPVRDASAVPGPDGELLVMGGETGSGASADGVFLVDQATGTLHQVDALPVAVHDAPAVVLGPKVLVVGGSNGVALSSVQGFPWSRLPASPPTGASSTTTVPQAASEGPLPDARAGAGAVVANNGTSNAVYIVGGGTGTTAQASVLKTSDARTYTLFAKLPVPVQDAGVAVLGTNLYVFGGYDTSAGRPVTDVQRVDLSTGATSIVAQLPVGVRGAAVFVMGGSASCLKCVGPYLYVAGGQEATAKIGQGTNSAVWGFNPANDHISVSGQLATPVAYAAATTEGKQEWLVGGESGGRTVASVQEISLASS